MQPTKRTAYYSAVELRALIKSELGYNARQVTVSARNSIRYTTLTVRDAAVDFSKVKVFAKGLDTWTMDQTDYCEGQSIDVGATEAVKAAWGAPFVAEIIKIVTQLGESTWAQLSNDKLLCRNERDFWIENKDARGCNAWASDVVALKPSAIAFLALGAAIV